MMILCTIGVQHSVPAAVRDSVGAAVQPGDQPPVLHCPGAAVQ